jgi:hypothetical protein
MTYLTIQPSAFVDNIVDGHEMTKLPYPFHCDERGNVQRQDFWHGKPLRIVGFAKDLKVHQVDLWWRDAWRDPAACVGLYAISENADGTMASHTSAIESAEIVRDTEPPAPDGSHRALGIQ